MKLVLDFGNTTQKAALFEGTKMLAFGYLNELNIQALRGKIDEMAVKTGKAGLIRSCILSSVIDYPVEIRHFLERNFNFIAFDHNTPVPIINRYKSPETLGKDRLASAIGAWSIFPESNSLAITCGSCITYDFINKQGEYSGGAISPGMMMRYKALHTFTSRLPLINKPGEPALTGSDTQESIISGVVNGMVFEIEGMISEYSAIYNDLRVILSGGDYKYFAVRLKSPIFATSNLVLAGLNQVIDYNEISKD